MSNPATGEIAVPYGLAVWSTGIGTRPIIMDFMKQVGQANRRVLATDEWLRVQGCDNVYALGDCATITQRKVMEDVDAIFRVADKDNSGTLTVMKIKNVLGDIYQRYPQVELYLKTNQMKGFNDLLKDKESEELNIEEFKKALAQVDSQVKMLPATAQDEEVEPPSPTLIHPRGRRHCLAPRIMLAEKDDETSSISPTPRSSPLTSTRG